MSGVDVAARSTNGMVCWDGWRVVSMCSVILVGRVGQLVEAVDL